MHLRSLYFLILNIILIHLSLSSRLVDSRLPKSTEPSIITTNSIDVHHKCIHCATTLLSTKSGTTHSPTTTRTSSTTSATEDDPIDDITIEYESSDSITSTESITHLPTDPITSTESSTHLLTSIQSIETIEYTLHNTNSSLLSNDSMINPYIVLVGKVHNTGYLLIASLITLPVLLVVFAAIYNTRFKGSDPPNSSSILKCFLNTTDLYTDIIFCILLLFKLKTILFIWCLIFIAISHLISNTIAIYYIIKWKKMSVLYVEQHNILVILLSFLVGFYAAIQLLSSKLFYLSAFSMQLSNAQSYRIQVLTICNNVLLRNIPLIIIQILSVFLEKEMDFITTIAFISSLFMLITGSLTLLSRCISTQCRFRYHFNSDNMVINIRLISDTMEVHHQFCHALFAQCFALCLGIPSDRVETVLITPINDGIRCNVEILLVDDEDKVLKNINDMQNNWNQAMAKFKLTLCKALHITEIDVDIVIVQHSQTSSNMQKTMREIEIVEVMSCSASLNDHILNMNTCDDAKYNQEHESAA